jgi:asparagine synthase (glutamine-hydrolysing)
VWWRDRPVYRAVRLARSEHLTYLSVPALLDLADRVRAAERRALPGALIEAGCARGGSTLVLAAAKRQERPLLVFDAFGMIPPPSERDGPDVHERYAAIVAGAAVGVGGRAYYGYEPDLRGQVDAMLTAAGYPLGANRIRLIEGLYDDTLHVDEPVALAHIDCDWHDAVATCLTRIAPHLVPGGTFVIDDYDDWSGCTRAVDSFLADHVDRYRLERRTRVHLVAREA